MYKIHRLTHTYKHLHVQIQNNVLLFFFFFGFTHTHKNVWQIDRSDTYLISGFEFEDKTPFRC